MRQSISRSQWRLSEYTKNMWMPTVGRS
jgi:hypothetical protein